MNATPLARGLHFSTYDPPLTFLYCINTLFSSLADTGALGAAGLWQSSRLTHKVKGCTEQLGSIVFECKPCIMQESMDLGLQVETLHVLSTAQNSAVSLTKMRKLEMLVVPE